METGISSLETHFIRSALKRRLGFEIVHSWSLLYFGWMCFYLVNSCKIAVNIMVP
jgi:hypothetical protein